MKDRDKLHLKEIINSMLISKANQSLKIERVNCQDYFSFEIFLIYFTHDEYEDLVHKYDVKAYTTRCLTWQLSSRQSLTTFKGKVGKMIRLLVKNQTVHREL